MSEKGIRKGIAGRSSKLLGMAARVAGHEVTHQMGRRVVSSAERLGAKTLALRVRQARVIAENLSQLKGAAMKAGQFLSVDAADLLPPEALEVLAKLQNEAEPLPFEAILGVLRDDLGDERLARLEALEARPAASASIGQVHRARVEGMDVAVKVQYPNVAESIPSDLAMIRRLASSWLLLAGRKVALDDVFEELETILELEADYRHEARCMEHYRACLDRDERYLVPRPFFELSSKRVLTMSWIEGIPLGRWLLSSPDQGRRQTFARALLDLYCMEFFDWGFVQTDPNPGNFLVVDGDRLAVLDFGATLSYDEEFRREYVELLRLMAQDDDGALIEGGIAFGLLDAREGPEARAAFAKMMRAATLPFAPQVQPFEFRDPDYQRQTRDLVFRFMQTLRFTAPPRRLLFLHRKLGGLFNLLKRLEVRLDLEPYWQRMIERRPPEVTGSSPAA